MRFVIALLLGVAVTCIYKFGPEFFQFHPYRIYKEIKDLQERVSTLEARQGIHE